MLVTGLPDAAPGAMNCFHDMRIALCLLLAATLMVAAYAKILMDVI
jgi:hypothetical protein